MSIAIVTNSKSEGPLTPIRSQQEKHFSFDNKLRFVQRCRETISINIILQYHFINCFQDTFEEISTIPLNDKNAKMKLPERYAFKMPLKSEFPPFPSKQDIF